MTVDRALWPRPRIVGEYSAVGCITVPLIQAVAEDLWRLRERSQLSTTDIANRAITSYEFVDRHLRAGYDLLVRDRRSGETQLVRFGCGRE